MKLHLLSYSLLSLYLYLFPIFNFPRLFSPSGMYIVSYPPPCGENDFKAVGKLGSVFKGWEVKGKGKEKKREKGRESSWIFIISLNVVILFVNHESNKLKTASKKLQVGKRFQSLKLGSFSKSLEQYTVHPFKHD